MGSGRQSDLSDQDDLRTLRERVDQLERLNAQLRDSEERLQILFEHAPDGYYLSDLKGTLVDGNAAAERITGYRREELVHSSFLKLKLLSARDLPRAASLLARNVLGQSTGPDEFTLTRKDGAAITVEISTRPVRVGNRRVVLGIARDITERKRVEHQLRERTKELRALYSLAEIAERKNASLDELCQELTDILPKSWQYEDIACARIRIGDREFRTGNFAESRWKLSAPVKVAGLVIGTLDVNYLDERPDEDEGPFLKEERRLLDALAERLGRITERKWAEEELRLSEARLEEAQRTARLGSWETNLVTAQVVWSDELCRLFEMAPETIRGGRDQVQAALVERIHPDDRARYEEAIAQSEHENARYDIEYRIRLCDGSQRYLHSQGGPTLGPGGNLVRLSGTVTDITERKQLEEQLARMARHDPLTGAQPLRPRRAAGTGSQPIGTIRPSDRLLDDRCQPVQGDQRSVRPCHG
jgi:PAS domain S-box-containing protein